MNSKFNQRQFYLNVSIAWIRCHQITHKFSNTLVLLVSQIIDYILSAAKLDHSILLFLVKLNKLNYVVLIFFQFGCATVYQLSFHQKNSNYFNQFWNVQNEFLFRTCMYATYAWVWPWRHLNKRLLAFDHSELHAKFEPHWKTRCWGIVLKDGGMAKHDTRFSFSYVTNKY